MSPATSGGHKPDALRDIYRDAVAEDRGPDAASSERILARARQRAWQLQESRGAAATRSRVTGQEEAVSDFSRPPAANDRHWRRHALGGMAVLGLAGWLMLQHAAWWDGGGRDASPAPSAETSPQPAGAPAAGTGMQAPPAAAPQAPMPQAAMPAPAAGNSGLPDARPRAMERPGPAAAQDAAKAMAVPQGPGGNRAAGKGAASEAAGKPQEAQLPWCSDEVADGVADAQAFAKDGEAPSAESGTPDCRPREKEQQRPLLNPGPR